MHICNNELKVEYQRQKVANYSDFWPKLLFDFWMSPDPREQLDKFVNAQDLYRFIKRYLPRSDEIQKPTINTYDFYPFFKIFDYNQDGYIDFDDFLTFLLPQDQLELRNKLNDKAYMEISNLQLAPFANMRPFLKDVAMLLHLELTLYREVQQAK